MNWTALFFERIRPGAKILFWHGRAYNDYLRDEAVMVLYPFHWLVSFAWRVNIAWARHRNRPSWIDRQVTARAKQLHERSENRRIMDQARRIVEELRES